MRLSSVSTMAYDDNGLVNNGTNLALGSTLTAEPVSKRKGSK